MMQIDKEKDEPRISQGDIYKEIEYIERIDEKSGIIEICKILFPYVIVLTQDCDLAQDYKIRSNENATKNHDKRLLSVIVAPLYIADHVFAGEHLEKLGFKMEKIAQNRTPGHDLKKNQKPRYHYLEFPSEDQIPELVLDFKHYFSVNVEYLKGVEATNFVCKVSQLYREDISQRFANYLSRIGLPNSKERSQNP